MPLFPLQIMVELLINGTWTDISTYVYQRDGIQITGGSQDKQPHDKPQPGTCTMTLDNRTGDFSPYNVSGAYYPYLKRNVQLRVSVVGATSSSGNTYTGYRFWGEVRDWPPNSDISGNDIFVSLVAHGPFRRLAKHGGKGSALARYYASLTGTNAPIAYWPCEEDPDTTQVQAGLSGGQNMSVTGGPPRWKSISNFNGSHPIGIVNRSTWTGVTGSFGGSGTDTFASPGTYDYVAPAATMDVRGIGGGEGGSNGVFNVQAGGHGGEFAQEATMAFTTGQLYKVIVGAGGSGAPGGASGTTGSAGGPSQVQGDAVLLKANGGGTGLTSSNTTHRAGGSGGTDLTFANRGGGGGGGSGGTASAGNGGANSTGSAGAAGGAAVAGGGKGGNGGDDGHNPSQGRPGGSPGGGGGGGGHNQDSGYEWQAGSGAPGQVQFVYTPVTTATVNVFRFILFVPKHQGNSGKVIVRFTTSSTKMQTIDVTFVTGAGGKLRMQAFDNVAAQQIDSGAQSWAVQGRTVMVSVELKKNGTGTDWAFKAIEPGSRTLIGSASGTLASSTVGNCSLVTVSPNADITKTAIGHISVQYSLIDLRKVSRALHGHHAELGIHRFIRLLNEEAMGNEPGYNETYDHWGFESGTQSWVGTNGALTNPTTSFTPVNDWNFVIKQTGASWPTDGTHSLLLTANGAGSPSTHSPSGLSGLNILAKDRVSVGAHVYTPTAIANMYIGIAFYDSGGALISESDAPDYATSAGEIVTLTQHADAPTGSAFFAVFVGNHGTLSNGTLIYIDDVVVHPKLGPQTRKKLHEFLHELRELDQGILRESRKLWGLGYRTRLSLLNQTAAITLDYSTGVLSGTPAPIEVPDPSQGKIRHRHHHHHPHIPHIGGHYGRHPHIPHIGGHYRHGLKLVFDEHNIKNDITVHRHKGSRVRVTLDAGSMSVQEPPGGTGRHRHHLRLAAHADEQLLAIATHLLNLGTVTDERYPEISVNLGRAGLTGNPMAPLMSAAAGIECGDFLKITNLPFWYPTATAKQLVIGYRETLNTFNWEITWNCTPESPWEISVTNVRRW